MAKMLGPSDYGILAVLMAFIYIFGIPGNAIQTIASKYTSKFNVNKEYGKMKDFLIKGLWRGFLFSLMIYIITLPIIFILSNLLNISFYLLALTFLFVFYIFAISVIRGVIQGKKKFLQLGFNLVIESSFKVAVSLLLVFIGFRVFGAVFGLIICAIITFILSFFAIKDILKFKRNKEKFPSIYLSNIPVLVSMTSLVLLYSLDIIFARILFSSEMAGQYAFVSLIAKAIFFGSSAISSAMLPISSEKYEKNDKTGGIFKKAMLMVLFICISALLVYLFFSKQVIYLLSLGSLQYLPASNILFILGLAYSFIAIANVLIIYGLSINKIGKISSMIAIIFVFIEIILLSVFNSSLMIFSINILIINLGYLIYALIALKK
jgi:O-antigen/teichoic acid export membrane protein